MDNIEESNLIADILNRTAVKCFNKKTSEVLQFFNEAESRCIEKTIDDELKLEVKRRVCEWKIRLLCDKNEVIEVIEPLINECKKIKFSDIWSQAETVIYFSMYCIRNGYQKKASFVLNELLVILVELNLSQNEYYDSLINKIECLLGDTV